jgi:hypothetical protein
MSTEKTPSAAWFSVNHNVDPTLVSTFEKIVEEEFKMLAAEVGSRMDKAAIYLLVSE